MFGRVELVFWCVLANFVREREQPCFIGRSLPERVLPWQRCVNVLFMWLCPLLGCAGPVLDLVVVDFSFAHRFPHDFSILAGECEVPGGTRVRGTQ